jgi:hypothetical protein
MDLQLITENNTWDFSVVDGLPVTVSGVNEKTQRALVASFLQPNTIPMLPAVGNPWTDYTTGKISLSEMDAKVRANINLFMDGYDYVPYYKIDKGVISYNVVNVSLSGVS